MINNNIHFITYIIKFRWNFYVKIKKKFIKIKNNIKTIQYFN